MIKYSWLEFHGSLTGRDVFLGTSKQDKYYLFATESDVEVGRIMDNTSSKYKVVRRPGWFEEQLAVRHFDRDTKFSIAGQLWEVVAINLEEMNLEIQHEESRQTIRLSDINDTMVFNSTDNDKTNQ